MTRVYGEAQQTQEAEVDLDISALTWSMQDEELFEAVLGDFFHAPSDTSSASESDTTEAAFQTECKDVLQVKAEQVDCAGPKGPTVGASISDGLKVSAPCTTAKNSAPKPQPSSSQDSASSAAAKGGSKKRTQVSSASSAAKPARKKGVSWSETEHRLFLKGLEVFGKGDWRSISRHIVTTRSPSQVASHAQKFFNRQKDKKEKRRPSIHDITTATGPPIKRLRPAGATTAPSPPASATAPATLLCSTPGLNAVGHFPGVGDSDTLLSLVHVQDALMPLPLLQGLPCAPELDALPPLSRVLTSARGFVDPFDVSG